MSKVIDEINSKIETINESGGKVYYTSQEWNDEIASSLLIIEEILEKLNNINYTKTLKTKLNELMSDVKNSKLDSILRDDSFGVDKNPLLEYFKTLKEAAEIVDKFNKSTPEEINEEIKKIDSLLDKLKKISINLLETVKNIAIGDAENLGASLKDTFIQAKNHGKKSIDWIKERRKFKKINEKTQLNFAKIEYCLFVTQYFDDKKRITGINFEELVEIFRKDNKKNKEKELAKFIFKLNNSVKVLWIDNYYDYIVKSYETRRGKGKSLQQVTNEIIKEETLQNSLPIETGLIAENIDKTLSKDKSYKANIPIDTFNSFNEIIENICDSLFDEHDDGKWFFARRRQEKDKKGYYVYQWYAFKNKETVKELDNEQKHPRVKGKVDNPNYAEIKQKDFDARVNGIKDHGKNYGLQLSMNGLTQLNTNFVKDQTFNVDTGEYPIIALGAAKLTQGMINLIRAKKLNKEDINVEELAWRWRSVDPTNREDDKKVIAGKVRGRVVDLSKIPNAIITSKTSNPIISKEDAEKLMKINDIGINKATAMVSFNEKFNPPDLNFKCDKHGFFDGNFLQLNKAMYCKGHAEGFISNDPNKFNGPPFYQLYPEIPFTLTNSRKEEIVIIPMMKRKANDKKPHIIIKPVTNPKKHFNPLKKEWGSNSEIKLAKADKSTKISNNKTSFQASKTASKPVKECYYYAFFAQLADDDNWYKIPSDKWIRGNGISITKDKTVIQNQKFDQFLLRSEKSNTPGWGYKGSETIVPNFTITGDDLANGKFRLYILMTKTNNPLNDNEFNNILNHPEKKHKELDKILFDFNYDTITIDRGAKVSLESLTRHGIKPLKSQKTKPMNEKKSLKKLHDDLKNQLKLETKRLTNDNYNEMLKWHNTHDKKSIESLIKTIKDYGNDLLNYNPKKKTIAIAIDILEQIDSEWKGKNDYNDFKKHISNINITHWHHYEFVNFLQKLEKEIDTPIRQN